jgi:hypothetical protein
MVGLISWKLAGLGGMVGFYISEIGRVGGLTYFIGKRWLYAAFPYALQKFYLAS